MSKYKTKTVQNIYLNVMKGNSQQYRPPVTMTTTTVGIPLPQNPISSHPNQSVVKMAAEKMKRKFLGWN